MDRETDIYIYISIHMYRRIVKLTGSRLSVPTAQKTYVC